MNKVSVLVANCVQADPRQTISAINWALEKNFENISIVPGLIKSKIRGPNGAGLPISINQIFAITTEDNFEKVMGGEPYTLNGAVMVPVLMAKENGGTVKQV